MHATPSENIAQRVRSRRAQLGLNRDQVAERCAQAGVPQLTAAALTNIETGRPDAAGNRRREVSTEELFTLAYVLRIHPVDLLVPVHSADDEPYSVTPGVTTTVGTARDWIAGHGFLVPPESAADLAAAIQSMPEGRAQEVASNWLRPRLPELNRQANALDADEPGREHGPGGRS